MTERKTPVIQEVRQVSEDDIDIVWGIIESCSDWLLEQGHNHWDKYYSEKMIRRKIKHADVHLASVEGKPVGTITLDTNHPFYYTGENVQCFTGQDETALYVSALAVLPEYQNRGIASELMQFAENKAKSEGIKHARLDCKALYVELVEFYRNRDYQIVGLIIDEKDNNEPYFLMEKSLA